MPEYKLIYFNMKGRAELIRWICVYGDIKYTDERIEEKDWPDKKKSVPGGKVPLLMVDTKPLPQSLAIARYLAKQAGLVPQDDLDAAYCDSFVDTASEIMTDKFAIIMSDKDEEEKTKEMDEFFATTMTPFMTRLDKRLEGREWFASDKITWADLFIGRFLGEMLVRRPARLENYPNLKKHIEKLVQLPRIKEWIASRPDTRF